MYAKIVILSKKVDAVGGGAAVVTIGFFDKKGTLQLQVPQIAGELFPKDMAVGKEIVFNYPTKAQEIKK